MLTQVTTGKIEGIIGNVKIYSVIENIRIIDLTENNKNELHGRSLRKL